MNELKRTNIKNILNRLIPIIETAEKQLKSARNWGYLDLFGGDTFIGFIKHYKLNKASNTMEEANYLLQQLNNELNGVVIPEEYKMQIGDFITFADFLFDGLIVDGLMINKILKSIKHISELKEKLYFLQEKI